MISPVKIWRSQKKIQRLLGISGTILSWTKVHVPPVGFAGQAPYILVIVEFPDGQRFTAQLVDWDEKNLHIGQKVISILRRTKDPGEEGIIPYGIKFKPIS